MSGQLKIGSAPSLRPLSAAAVPPRGEGAEPTTFPPIQDPVLRAAFMDAQREWAKRYCPHLLKEWGDR